MIVCSDFCLTGFTLAPTSSGPKIFSAFPTSWTMTRQLALSFYVSYCCCSKGEYPTMCWILHALCAVSNSFFANPTWFFHVMLTYHDLKKLIFVRFNKCSLLFVFGLNTSPWSFCCMQCPNFPSESLQIEH